MNREYSTITKISKFLNPILFDAKQILNVLCNSWTKKHLTKKHLLQIQSMLDLATDICPFKDFNFLSLFFYFVHSTLHLNCLKK